MKCQFFVICCLSACAINTNAPSAPASGGNPTGSAGQSDAQVINMNPDASVTTSPTCKIWNSSNGTLSALLRSTQETFRPASVSASWDRTVCPRQRLEVIFWSRNDCTPDPKQNASLTMILDARSSTDLLPGVYSLEPFSVMSNISLLLERTSTNPNTVLRWGQCGDSNSGQVLVDELDPQRGGNFGTTFNVELAGCAQNGLASIQGTTNILLPESHTQACSH